MIRALLLLPPAVMLGQITCPREAIQPGGDLVEERFVRVSPARAQEAAADALQVAGFGIFKLSETVVEGERTNELIRALRLPDGNEAMSITIAPAARDGVAGTLLLATTLRSGMKSGRPKRMWSASVVAAAACLAEVISPDDPSRKVFQPEGPPPTLPEGIAVPVRIRRFLETVKTKPGKTVWFETVSDIVQDGAVVIPKGSPVIARAFLQNDIGSFGKAARGGVVFESVIAPNGAKAPLRGLVRLDGRSGNGAALGVLAVGVSGWFAAVTGSEFALPASAILSAETGAAIPSK